MKTFDKSYIELLKEIEKFGNLEKNERTGIECKSLFTKVLEATDSEGYSGFPISNTRKIHYKGAIIETLWLLGLHRNDERYKDLPLTNTQYLEDHGVRYWRPWQDINGNLGPVYGEQLVNWYDHNTNTHINQIQNIIDTLRTNPSDRRLVASMWNPAEIPNMALPPCHHSLWFYSTEIKDDYGHSIRRLDTTWHQRSADMPIGIPYNILMYTIINKIVAICTGHVPGVVRGVLGNAHYYLNQQEGVDEIINREEEVKTCSVPKLRLSDSIMTKLLTGKQINLEDFAIDGSDFIVENYNPLSPIKMPVAV